jgi:tetratricopeptide (TPR) repeat protein
MTVKKIGFLKLLPAYLVVSVLLQGTILLVVSGCEESSSLHVAGSEVRVAKVDTEYVYEANISKHVEDYRQGRRTRISNFIGFTPNQILMVREDAIDHEIRKEIRRLPGVNLSSVEVNELAGQNMEDLARELFDRITRDGENFARIALEYSDSDTARMGGAFPMFGIQENPQEYQSLAYEMKIGEVSEPFLNYEGWRIIRLDNITEDPFAGKFYEISMIVLTPDVSEAEAQMIDEIAESHAIEILDSKYNSRQALIGNNIELALTLSEETLVRNEGDDLAHYLRARALWELGRQDEAFEALETAAEVGKISDALIPYYHYYRGVYYEEINEAENANQAYRDCFDNWRQDINLAYMLKATFERSGDEEYLGMIEEEIEIILTQDINAIMASDFGASGGGVIKTSQGTTEGSSVEYEEGYRE